jgi:hypothetical protein
MKLKKIIINFLLGCFLIFISSHYSFAWLKHLSVKLSFIDNKLFFIFSKPQKIGSIQIFLHDEFEKARKECKKLKANSSNKVCQGVRDFAVWSIGRDVNSEDNDYPIIEKIEYGQEIKGLITSVKAKELKKNVRYEFLIGTSEGRAGGIFMITEDNKLIYPADKINIPEKYSASDKK